MEKIQRQPVGQQSAPAGQAVRAVVLFDGAVRQQGRHLAFEMIFEFRADPPDFIRGAAPHGAQAGQDVFVVLLDGRQDLPFKRDGPGFDVRIDPTKEALERPFFPGEGSTAFFVV